MNGRIVSVHRVALHFHEHALEDPADVGADRGKLRVGSPLGPVNRQRTRTGDTSWILGTSEKSNSVSYSVGGLAGVGDLVLTCTGDLSRNRRLGLALGRAAGIELPISEQVLRVLREEITPAEGLRILLAREQNPIIPNRSEAVPSCAMQ